MKRYKVLVSNLALNQIKDAKRYIKVKFKNEQALSHLSDSIKKAKEKLEYTAESARDYDKSNGTKVIHLDMNYKFIFSFADEDTVLIEEFLHDLQDE